MSAIGGILLQKSKIEQPKKSRESRSRGFSAATSLVSATTEVRDQLWMKRYGPSRRRAQNASAVLRIFVRHLKKTFATKSGAKRPSRRRDATSVFDPERTSRCFGSGAESRILHQNAVEQFQQVAQRRRLLVGCAAASMRYHDEIRVFSRLMAKSVVGNNQ
jgi:hypothetical protein